MNVAAGQTPSSAEQPPPLRATWLSREWFLLALVAASLLGVRLWRLDADPPALLEGDFLSDEGWWAHNARNHALFGRWILDEHNPPIFGAPLWTLSLRAVYGLFGVGLLQTRLLSALAGVATCVAIYAIVRRSGGPRAAGLASVLLGLDPFSLVYHRSAFVESFMTAFLAGGFAVLGGSVGRPARAALAGALLALGVLVKLWAAGALAGVLLWWIARAWLATTDATANGPVRKEVLGFVAGAGAIALVALASALALDPQGTIDGILVHRHRAEISNPWRNLAVLGVHFGDGLRDMRPAGFVSGSWPLIAAFGIALALALVRRLRWLRDPPALALLTWFVASAGQIAAQGYQPDRRFVVIVPSIAGLVALAWAAGGFAPPTRADLAVAGRWRRVSALAVAAGAAAFLARGAVLSWLSGVASAPLADLAPTPAIIGGATGLALFALAALVFALAARTLARRMQPRWVLAAPLAAAFAYVSSTGLHEVGRAGTSVRDVSRALATATHQWPEAQRRMVGDAADTLALETQLFAFVIRRWDWVSMTMNENGWARFEPWIAVGMEPERAGFVRLPDLELCPDDDTGEPRCRMTLHVRAEGAEDVRAALGEMQARSLVHQRGAE